MPIENRATYGRRLSHLKGLLDDAFNEWADLRDDLPSGDPHKALARGVAAKLEVALVKVTEARDKARQDHGEKLV